MAGALTISTLNNDTGVLATHNGMTAIPKAFAQVTSSGATLTINNSFNISSITVTGGTSVNTVNFTTAMPNANYMPIITCSLSATPAVSFAQLYWNGSATVAPTTSSFVFYTINGSGGQTVPLYFSIAVLGS
jgi:hypothetical protein